MTDELPLDMFLRQIALTGVIPFSVSLPKAPAAVNVDGMRAKQLKTELLVGYKDMQAGHVQDAAAAFSAFREAHS